MRERGIVAEEGGERGEVAGDDGVRGGLEAGGGTVGQGKRLHVRGERGPAREAVLMGHGLLRVRQHGRGRVTLARGGEARGRADAPQRPGIGVAGVAEELLGLLSVLGEAGAGRKRNGVQNVLLSACPASARAG